MLLAKIKSNMEGIYITKFGSAEASFSKQKMHLRDLEADEVLIKTSAFGINYADIMARQGLYKEAPSLPFVPGYEVVGTITKTGKDAEHLLNKRIVGFTRFGGYATHAISNKNAIVVLGDEVPQAEALALATQFATAYYATHYVQNIRRGEVVLIHASAGGVGIALNQLCKNSGAITIGLCSGEEKLNFCSSQNFDFVFDYTNDDYIDKIKSIFPKGIDVCFNSLAGKSFSKEKKLLNFCARVVLYGGASRSGMKGGILATLKMVWQMGIVIPIGLMMNSRSIIGINMLKIADYKPEILSHCLQEVMKLYLSGKLKPVANHIFSSDNIADAHRLIEQRKSIGKVVCTM